MKDELYIQANERGAWHRMELDKDVNINLIFESVLFSELGSVKSNGTYNVALPKTAHNLKAIDNFHLADKKDSEDSFPRSTLRASLYRDGLPIFENGAAYLQNITDRINFVFTWGGVDLFKKMSDYKLTDLL